MPNPKTIQKAKEYLSGKDVDYSNLVIWLAEFAEQHALENCTCREDETTGSMEEWVCNNCGRVQK